MTVTFESISRADVTDIARRVSALPWVVAAVLEVDESSPSSDEQLTTSGRAWLGAVTRP